ncbi:MAG: N-6 DNA methylase [Clostridia bacterium]|nr:N-6 DNA methylase [Clostridia bacterium]
MQEELIEKIRSRVFKTEDYINSVLTLGINKTWEALISYLEEVGIDTFSETVIDFFDIGRLYEIGLAIDDKYIKKDSGQYYTPNDVAHLMASFLVEGNRLTNLYDIGCGCGNLTIEVLKTIKNRSETEFENLLNNIFLFEIDKTALAICLARISCYFRIPKSSIKVATNDFLSKNATLHKRDLFIIANPPYSKITAIEEEWEYKSCILESKDLYVGFLEKIILHAKKAVIVTPQSYIVGKNFSKLRALLFQEGSGEIYTFDNVPGTLFNGKKEGIFNTNCSNGVRASILVFKHDSELIHGYRMTHLIRFKNEERKTVLTPEYLKSLLGTRKQDLLKPLKCPVDLEGFVYNISKNSTGCLRNLISKNKNGFPIYINSSARYFIVATKAPMKRKGIYIFYAKDEVAFYLLYALLNSSYCYLWWRMMDGGILIPQKLLMDIPIPDIRLDRNLKSVIDEMIRSESKYLVYKKNAGALQESVKFPHFYREKINNLLFGDIDFTRIHKNSEG